MQDSLLSKYDDVLIGRASILDASNFLNTGNTSNAKRALSVFKYAIESVLGWTPQEAIYNFDMFTLKNMQLENLFAYINVPDEFKKDKSKYILAQLYPKLVYDTEEERIINAYKSVLCNEGLQFPREYFLGSDGFYRFCVCLKYAIENYTFFNTLDDVWEFISSPKGNKFLFEKRLLVPADYYMLNIKQALYEITKDYEDSFLWFLSSIFEEQLAKKGVS